MDVRLAPHPSADTLRAFELGKLDAAATAAVRRHLDTCRECSQKSSGSAGGALPANLPKELADHPQYEVVRELGRGGMGVVYLARNRLMERPEVLKVVNRSLLDHPEAAERFLREVRSAARLSHRNIVTA